MGFLDEFSPQNNCNTQRLWYLEKNIITKNSTKFKANTFGFYSINGNSVVDFKEKSTKECIVEFLKKIRENNSVKRIIIVLDNFRSHRSNFTINEALKLNITLVFLPPYSPDLNPIEFIWKSIKRKISPIFIENLEKLRELIKNEFNKLSKSNSFAENWIKKILKNKIIS